MARQYAGNAPRGHASRRVALALYEPQADAAGFEGNSFLPGGNNAGCALPIARFDFISDGVTSGLPAGMVETLDPRMVMTIHEAFTQ